MISDSKDIFYLVLSFCVLWFTIFICWLLYYFIAIMRETRGMAKDAREQVKNFMSALDNLKEKFERSLNVFAGIAEGVKYVGSYLMDMRRERKSTAHKKKTEKSAESTDEEKE